MKRRELLALLAGVPFLPTAVAAAPVSPYATLITAGLLTPTEVRYAHPYFLDTETGLVTKGEPVPIYVEPERVHLTIRNDGDKPIYLSHWVQF
jgi:hypothetical protein